MSEASKSKTRKPRTTKPSTGTDAESVETSAETKSTQAEQDAMKQVEGESNTESSSEKPQSVEDEKTEQSAEMSDSDKPEETVNEKVETQDPESSSGSDSNNDSDVLGILGALKVRSKSNQGFWRSGVQFLRQKETILLVVDEEPKDQPEIVAQEGIESELILFMSKEKAERVHREPNLDVETVELSDVIDIEQL
ncbi:hypothetical protein [Vibrio parahaemolyticus]|uniref:hypothetical protein n=1 Tax=Vibrio parahaemolyticus TaxID=670 RepID=UPI0028DEA060|nr:hypothetical protein [Vibrio parahaemolyticus]MDT8844792.1 hypothetical protein [Vibrio parahaemolyticus]MDT8917152.1 hypothetical protein [Vibrio parahaemolyticus]